MEPPKKDSELLQDHPLGELGHWIDTLEDGFAMKDIRRQLHTNLFYKAAATGMLTVEDIELQNSLLCVIEEAMECKARGLLKDH